MRSLLIPAALALACAGAPVKPAHAKTEVVVLSTLHQLHAETPGYGFDALATAIEQLRPDALGVELTAADLASRRPQRVKQEYEKAILPAADRIRIPTFPLEPDEPEFSRLVGLMRGAEQRLDQTEPAKAAAVGGFQDALYAEIRPRWTSPAAVNGAPMDLVMAVKHRWQSEVVGPDEAAAWDGWNRVFLARILAAAKAHPGGRIVACVGLEHGYWLRRALADEPSVTLLDAAALLAR